MAKVVKRIRMLGHTRVSPKHQITIPVEAMRRAGLVEGDRLEISEASSGRVVLIRTDNPVERFAGRLTGVYPPNSIDALRNEWE